MIEGVIYFTLYTLIEYNCIPNLKEKKKLFLSYSEKYSPLCLRLGVDILDTLILFGILTKTEGSPQGLKTPADIDEIWLYNKEQKCKSNSDLHKVNIPYIYFNHDQFTSFMASTSFTKPLLHHNSKPQANVDKIYNQQFNISFEQSSNDIKSSNHSTLIPNDNFKSMLQAANTVKHIVNIKNLTNFYETLGWATASNFDVENTEILNILMVLYDLDFKAILKATPHTSTIRELMMYGLLLQKFPSNFTTELSEKCLQNSTLSFIYHIIYSRKFYLIGLFNDLELFKSFHFFYIPKNIACTGRMFSMPYYITLQGPKITRSFVTFYPTPIITEEQFNVMHHGFTSVIATMPSFSYTDYISHLELGYKNYLQSFLLPQYKEIVFSNFPYAESLNNQLTFMHNKTKKIQDILYLTTLLSANSFSPGVIYEKDATTSGTGLVSLIMQDADLARASNLTGDIYADLYDQFNIAFQLSVTNIKNNLKDFFNQILNMDLDDPLFHKTHEITPSSLTEDNLTNILLFLFCKPSLKVVTKNIEDTDVVNILAFLAKLEGSTVETQSSIIKKKILKHPLCNNDTWLYTKDTRIFLNMLKKQKDSKNNLILNLMSIREYLRFYLICKPIPQEALFIRNLHKSAVMTFTYGAKALSRSRNFINYFNEYYAVRGLDKTINFKHITSYLERFFVYQQALILPTLTAFMEACKKYIIQGISTKKPLEVALPFVTWEFASYDVVIKRINHLTPHKGVSQRTNFNIYLPQNKFNEAQMLIKFPSIFIHGLDATIVHHFYDILRQLNQDFELLGLPPISGFTNHDCYGVNLTYSPYLQLIIAYIYNKLSASNLGNLINVPQDFNKNPIQITNKSFIKH